jgi:hypothetical protein
MSVSLDARNLSQPHILRIETSGHELAGHIILNGKVIKEMKGKYVEINLSPFLSSGLQKLEISANYFPVDSFVSLELDAPSTHVSQQSNSNGKLNASLNITVR